MYKLMKNSLKYGVNAIAEFDAISNIDFLKLIQSISDESSHENGIPVTMLQIRNLVYAGMLHKDTTLTPSQVGDILDKYLENHDITEVVEIIVTAIMNSYVFKTKLKAVDKNGKI
jgi:hypothetical protein